MKLTIQVIPNASRTELVSRDVQGWKVRLAAPPIDGKANEALVAFLAEYFGRPKSSIHIKHGQTGKRKLVEIDEA